MPARPAKPKVRLPGSPRYHAIRNRTRDLRLATVCQEAACPNIGECWGAGTATFMLMGHTCTRGCRFCGVRTSAHPPALDPEEPAHLAEAVVAMALDFVVLTSVDRDDVPDGGAAHFAACVQAVRQARPEARVEVLIPDYRGQHLATLLASQPDVVGHNVETVERLTPMVRDRRASYRTSLQVLAQTKQLDPSRYTKSSIMVGLGETDAEVVQTMRDLREVGTDFLTIGQYLQPSKRHLEVVEYVSDERFAAWERQGLELGFSYVASGPLVRSSYKAGEMFLEEFLDKQEVGS